jgi:hypothetical protein
MDRRSVSLRPGFFLSVLGVYAFDSAIPTGLRILTSAGANGADHHDRRHACGHYDQQIATQAVRNQRKDARTEPLDEQRLPSMPPGTEEYARGVRRPSHRRACDPVGSSLLTRIRPDSRTPRPRHRYVPTALAMTSSVTSSIAPSDSPLNQIRGGTADQSARDYAPLRIRQISSGPAMAPHTSADTGSRARLADEQDHEVQGFRKRKPSRISGGKDPARW